MESLNFSSFVENKEVKIRILIKTIKEYLATGTEDVALRLNRNLQLLSCCQDLSLFDSETIISAQFYPNLYALMNKLDPWSQTLWSCVDVLRAVCKNRTARKALINNYQFVLPLSKMLGDQLTTERKATLLELIQELTCGIEIEWQIPYLEHLMLTLAKWAQGNYDPICILSLGILVNVCYKNVPAMYMFSKCVNVKEFLKYPPQQSSIKELHFCKLMILLDCNSHSVYDELLFTLIEKTFDGVCEALPGNDVAQLRQIVEFFSDISMNKHVSKIGVYEKYKECVQALLLAMDSPPKKRKQESCETPDPECIAIILEFLSTLIKLNIPSIQSVYFEIIHFALKWTQVDGASEQAFIVLKTIASNVHAENDNVIESLIAPLPSFLQILSSKKDDTINSSSERTNRISALLQLLYTLLPMQQVRAMLLQDLTNDMMADIFAPLQNDVPPDFDIFNTDKVSLYVFALALVAALARYSQKWVTFLEDLMRDKIIQTVMVYAVYKNTSTDVKKAFLDISTHPRFPQADFAANMCNLQSLFITNCPRIMQNLEYSGDFNPLPLSVAQTQKLNDILDRHQALIAEGRILDIPTSEIIELYELKFSGQEAAKRADQKCLEGALERNKIIPQMNKEQNRLHQLLVYTQRRCEEVTRQKENKTKALKGMQTKFDAEKGRNKVAESQLKIKEQQLIELQAEFELTSKKFKDSVAALNECKDRSSELKQLLEKVDGNYKRQEKLLEKKVESIKELTSRNSALEEEIKKLRQELKTTTEKLEFAQDELEKKTNVILTITQMALRSSSNSSVSH